MDVAGLVSSIITFVDFSWTIVRGAYDVHRSASGATEENVHIGHVLKDLRAVTEKMRMELPGQDHHEKALLELEHQCRGLSADLADVLGKLTKRRRSGLQSLNIMLRSLMKEKEIREIERRLGEYRGQMILRLNLMLWERSATVQHPLGLDQNAQEIRLQDLKQKAAALADDNSVLRRLYFDDMYKRAEGITDATDGTFDWFLADHDASPREGTPEKASDDDNLKTQEPRWERELRQQSAAKISTFLQHGRGVFFLRGKPGSGKSTLMKYLTGGRGKQKIDRRLRTWAGQKRLIRVSTMFMLHGTPLQRSLEGFYRAFFFELLCQCPELLDVFFPKDSRRKFPDDSYRSSFPLDILREAWVNLTSIRHHEKLRICVSIDGLDEIEGNSGDRLRFAQIINDWAQSEDIKIICSGRPNAEFKVFGQPEQQIDLQDLTRPDIRKISMERFKEVRHFGDLTQDNIEELVSCIADQSEGVILWAVLVGKSLEDDAIHGKPLSAMKRTITMQPPGIEALYNSMWQDVRQGGHQQLMLQTIYELLVLSNKNSMLGSALPAVCFYWLGDALFDDQFPYNQPIQALPTTDVDSLLGKARSQLIQCTKHLVETTDRSRTYDDGIYVVQGCQFIHRSAQEFIHSNLDLAGAVTTLSDRTFDLYLRLQLAYEIDVGFHGRSDMALTFFSYALSCYRNDKKRMSHPGYQLPHKMMEKLRELPEARPCPLVGNYWQRFDFPLRRSRRPLRRSIRPGRRSTTFSHFHWALARHQVDYVNRALRCEIQKISKEALSLGLLICVAGSDPCYECFKLLVDHGADLDTMIELYRPRNPSDPELVPLWLLLCFLLPLQFSGRDLATEGTLMHPQPLSGLRGDVPTSHGFQLRDDVACNGGLDPVLANHFLILEHFMQTGRGTNVKFLAAPTGGFPEPEDDELFGIDLAQIVRLAKPDNMNRLLFLLDPQALKGLSLLQKLINVVLQPSFFPQSLPQGTATMPYRRVSDDHLIRHEWAVWCAFEGEHEINGRFEYYIPK